MKTTELNKGDYFRIKGNDNVFELDKVIIRPTVFGESTIVKCTNIITDQYCILFPNIEVECVLSETEKQEVNDYYGI